MKTYTFIMEEPASEFFLTPTDSRIERKLTIPKFWEVPESDQLFKIHETFIRFLANDGNSLPNVCATMYNVMRSMLKVSGYTNNPEEFFKKFKPFSVETYIGDEKTESDDIPDFSGEYENPAFREMGFDKFCQQVEARGGFARKVYADFLKSLSDN